MKKIVILRGVPGAGKTTAAKQLFVEQGLAGVPVVSVSADYFFERDGVYRFDGSKLGEAHGACLRSFLRHLQQIADGLPMILVVDNTSLTVMEMITYVRLAQAFGVPFEVLTVECDPAIAAARGLHSVPVAKVFEMHRRMKEAKLPRDWPHIIKQAGI